MAQKTEGEWAAALRRSLSEKVPGLLQKLRDDKAGKTRLTSTQRKAAMALLRKVMTPSQIRAALEGTK